MSDTLLDTYFNRLKADPDYSINHEEWTGGLFHGPWELREDDNEVRIEIKSYRHPVLGMMCVSIVLFLMVALMARFAYNHDNQMYVYIIFPIAFLTSIVLISIGFAMGRNLKKKGRCWVTWNRFQDTVSLPRRNITLSCADIVALQHGRRDSGQEYSNFEIIAAPDGILRRYHVFQLSAWGGQTQVIRTLALRLKKPLVVSTCTWIGRRVVTMENVLEDKK
jgi:hypothetical protein